MRTFNQKEITEITEVFNDSVDHMSEKLNTYLGYTSVENDKLYAAYLLSQQALKEAKENFERLLTKF